MLTPARMSRKLKRKASLVYKPESAPELSFLPTRRFGLLSFKNLPILHHELYALHRLDVAQRIPADRGNIGKCSGSYDADLALHLEHHGRPRSSRLNRIHGRHAELHHARKFLRNGLGPRDSAHVGAEDDLHS